MIRLALASLFLLGCAARSEIAGESVDGSIVETSTIDAGTDACAAIEAQLDQAAAAASTCCPTCNIVQCTNELPGVCCPLAVSLTSSPEATTYLKALDAFKSSGCSIFCPSGCPAQQHLCEANGACAQP